MSWIEKLYQTYENNTEHIGSRKDNGKNKTPLLPIFHTIKKRAHIEISLDENGLFKRASIIPEDNAKTILPATENSAGRTSGCAPHPLADQLQYVAADYNQFGGSKKSYFEGFQKKNKNYVDGYRDSLRKWAESDFACQKVRVVYKYITKTTLIADLVSEKVLHVDETGKLMNSWKGKRDDKPDIFNALAQGQKQVDVFVRWNVEIPGDPSSELQYDDIVWQSWINYYLSTRSQKAFCYVTGEKGWRTEQYPRMIRSENDGAKLVSSNDSSGFTYRGRFTDEYQVCGLDIEIAQKAHNALRWLINRQGKVIKVKREPQLAIVSWAVSSVNVPDPLADSNDLLGDFFSIDESKSVVINSSGFTAKDFGIRLSKYLSGYSIKLGSTDQIIVMGVDSATPGRMALTYYRELTGSDFLKRIESWHKGCSWLQRFSKDKIFYGAPAPKDIAQAAYGIKDGDVIKLDDNMQKIAVERLIPCIIDGVPIPWDIVDSCIRKTTQRQSLPEWAWEKNLGITCGLYRYYFKETEGYTMGLDRERKTRDYLYGRLLAVADCLEGYALKLSNEKRQTNATKLMQRFAERPCSTWKTIELALVPYKARLNRNNKYDNEIDDIHGLFKDVSGYASDDPLTGEFLLGFHCQRVELFKPTQENTFSKEENKNESN